MRIGPVDNGERPIRPEEDGRRPDVNPDMQRRMEDIDRVEISPVAREMSEQAAASAEENNPAEDNNEVRLRREKIEQARQRAESGYYDSRAVKEEVARRITDDFIR